jgi:transcriptional regulator GlxA family with amidase domain
MKVMSCEYYIKNTDKQRVIFLVLPEVELLNLAGSAQVFEVAHRLGTTYSLHFCCSNTQVKSAQGLFFGQLEPLPTISANDLIIVPGTLSDWSANEPQLDAQTRNWLSSAPSAGAQVASVSTGAFLLGEAGLLDNRRCTTDWSFIETLQQRYPTAHVLDTVLYVCDSGVTTNAGIASGIDMALCLVEKKHSHRLAADVARWLGVYFRRNDTNSQLSPCLECCNQLHPAVHEIQEWLAEHATEPVSLANLAAMAQMSVRNFSRIFKEATGLTPVQYQQRLRLTMAESLLANSNLSIEAIATQCGFEDARHFRRLWHKYFGSSPSHARAKEFNFC